MTNQQVINAWVNQVFGENANLSSDGRFLRSYGVVIAENRNGVRVTKKKYSVTTSRHTNMALVTARAAGQEITFWENN